MTLDAIGFIRELAPTARIDLVVGSWNRDLARMMSCVDSVETLDLPWMARERPGGSWTAMLRQARSWRARRYDLAINFEPDIRSNVLLAALERRDASDSSRAAEAAAHRIACVRTCGACRDQRRAAGRLAPFLGRGPHRAGRRTATRCPLQIPERRRGVAALIDRAGSPDGRSSACSRRPGARSRNGIPFDSPRPALSWRARAA